MPGFALVQRAQSEVDSVAPRWLKSNYLIMDLVLGRDNFTNKTLYFIAKPFLSCHLVTFLKVVFFQFVVFFFCALFFEFS